MVAIGTFFRQYKRIVIKCAAVAALLIFVYVFVKVIFGYIAPFIIGYLISLAMEPFACLLTRKLKISRSIAAFFCVIMIVAVFGGAGTAVVMKLVSEGKSYISGVPYYVQGIAQAFERLKSMFNDQLLFVSDSFQSVLENAVQVLVNGMTGSLSQGVKNGSLNVVVSIPGFMMGFILSVISTFFFIKDRQIISSQIGGIAPLWLREKTVIMRVGMLNVIKGYFKAQFILMSINAIICIMGLLILGYPYALFVGLAIAAVDALPIFGAGTILWPWAAYCLIMNDYSRALGLMAIYGVVLIVRQSLEPRIIGDHIGIHPLITLMSIYIGLRVLGVPGIFLGPVLAVMIKMIVEMEFD